MNKPRVLAIIAILLGGIYLQAGISSFLQYRNIQANFAQYGVSLEIQMSVPAIASDLNRLFAAAIAFPLLGIVVLFVGVGLRLSWSWARVGWLGLICFLTVFHTVLLVHDFLRLVPTAFFRIGEPVFFGSLSVVSWLWLYKR